MVRSFPITLFKYAHLLCFPHPSSLRRTSRYASFLRMSGVLHLDIFEQPAKNDFFSNLLDRFIPSIYVERYYILAKETNSCGVTLLIEGYRFLMKAAGFDPFDGAKPRL